MIPKNLTELIIPVFITFGPLLMVLWLKSENTLGKFSIFGALMLMWGLIWMLAKVNRLEKEIKKLRGNPQE